MGPLDSSQDLPYGNRAEDTPASFHRDPKLFSQATTFTTITITTFSTNLATTATMSVNCTPQNVPLIICLP